MNLVSFKFIVINNTLRLVCFLLKYHKKRNQKGILFWLAATTHLPNKTQQDYTSPLQPLRACEVNSLGATINDKSSTTKICLGAYFYYVDVYAVNRELNFCRILNAPFAALNLQLTCNILWYTKQFILCIDYVNLKMRQSLSDRRKICHVHQTYVLV